jgi:hypothetical protein
MLFHLMYTSSFPFHLVKTDLNATSVQSLLAGSPAASIVHVHNDI